jgi:hypothetical protein
MLFLRQMEKLSHHRSGIPVDFEGVLSTYCSVWDLGQYSRFTSSMVESGIWQIVHSLDSYKPVFFKWSARQSYPVLSLKYF